MNQLTRLGLYWHTLKHLRHEQILGRIQARLTPSRATLGEALPQRSRNNSWVGHRWRQPSWQAPNRFSFLNREHAIHLDREGWCLPQEESLWNYNLHYFDHLLAAGTPQQAQEVHGLLHQWIASNPCPSGIGWLAYPTSLRITNWIKWILNGAQGTPELFRSLVQQTRHLENNLETYLLGNHLIANAKALVFSGLFFQGPEPDRWLHLGMTLLEREFQEQILPDGGHFERSPMYHAIILEDLLDLENIFRTIPSPLGDFAFLRRIPRLVPSMLSWLACMTHPDGEVSFFNDSAPGVAPPFAALADYAMALGYERTSPMGQGLRVLKESGYVRLAIGEATVLFDAAKLGPDYIPGHAHADTLSLELSLGTRRILVNAGTSTYEPGPERLLQRSSAAHNTVLIDGENSSEVWGSFRVARRSQPMDLLCKESPHRLEVSASQDGFRRLPGRVSHRRALTLTEDALLVEDHLQGRFREAVLWWHLHPEVALGTGSSGGQKLMAPDRGPICWHHDGDRYEEVEDNYHPAFGCSLPSRSLRCALHPGFNHHTFRWG